MILHKRDMLLLIVLNMFTGLIASEKMIKKPLPPKYDAVKVLREWVNDPEFSKKIQQEQVGKPVDTEGLVAHKVNGTEQAVKVSDISENHARQGRVYIEQLAILSRYLETMRAQQAVSGNLFTIGADLQHGGKYVPIPKNNENVRFGRGSSGKDKPAKL